MEPIRLTGVPARVFALLVRQEMVTGEEIAGLDDGSRNLFLLVRLKTCERPTIYNAQHAYSPERLDQAIQRACPVVDEASARGYALSLQRDVCVEVGSAGQGFTVRSTAEILRLMLAWTAYLEFAEVVCEDRTFTRPQPARCAQCLRPRMTDHSYCSGCGQPLGAS